MAGDHDHDAQVRRFGLCPVCTVDPGPAQASLQLGEVQCAFGCGEAVNPNDPRTYQQQARWTRPRAQGGTNALALRQPVPGRYAHAECIERAKRGWVDQPALPTEEF